MIERRDIPLVVYSNGERHIVGFVTLPDGIEVLGVTRAGSLDPVNLFNHPTAEFSVCINVPEDQLPVVESPPLRDKVPGQPRIRFESPASTDETQVIPRILDNTNTTRFRKGIASIRWKDRY